MRRREPPCAVAPNLCPAESKCMSTSKSSLAMRAADIMLAQNEICRVRAARGVAFSALRWSTFGLLACVRCTFLSRMVLPPQRGAHFAYLRGHEHHLGLAKWSSRLRTVRIFKNEVSPARGAHLPSGLVAFIVGFGDTYSRKSAGNHILNQDLNHQGCQIYLQRSKQKYKSNVALRLTGAIM